VLRGTDSIKVRDSLFIKGNRGVQVGDAGVGTTVSGLELANVVADQMTNEGFRFALCRDAEVASCTAQSCGIGMDIRPSAIGVKVLGGLYQGNTGDGIVLRAGVHTQLNGCHVLANNTANGAFSVGIAVAAGTTDFRIKAVRSGNVGPSGGHQKYGLQINAGASDRYVVTDCDFSDNETAALDDSGTGTNKRLMNNLPLTAGGGVIASAATVFATPLDEVFSVTGTTNIQTINGGFRGRRITLIFAAALSLVHGTGNLRLTGSANLAVTANDVLQLVFDGTNWQQAAPLVAI
jgi:hypothetical protein